MAEDWPTPETEDQGGGGTAVIATADEDWEREERGTRMSGERAAGAPCTISNALDRLHRRLGERTMLEAPPPSSAPAQRRGQCASGAAGVAGYAVFPLPLSRARSLWDNLCTM